MLEYAAQDVIYLPPLFGKLQAKLFMLDISPHELFYESNKYNFYASINKARENDSELVALVKNIQKDKVYCALNIG